LSARRKRIKPIPNPNPNPNPNPDPTVKATTRHRVNVGLRPTQPNLLPINKNNEIKNDSPFDRLRANGWY